MRRHDERALVPDGPLERENDRDRAAADPAERAERRVDEHDAACLDSERREISGQRVDRRRGLRVGDGLRLGHRAR